MSRYKVMYDYDQDRLPFKVYGACLFKIRNQLGFNQSEFAQLLEVNLSVYSKYETPIARGSYEYKKPTKQFYDNFCDWYTSLLLPIRNIIESIVISTVEVEEQFDLNQTAANQHTAICRLIKQNNSFPINQYCFKTPCKLTQEEIQSIQEVLLNRGIPVYMYEKKETS